MNPGKELRFKNIAEKLMEAKKLQMLGVSLQRKKNYIEIPETRKLKTCCSSDLLILLKIIAANELFSYRGKLSLVSFETRV